jgi:hypothetical protein
LQAEDNLKPCDEIGTELEITEPGCWKAKYSFTGKNSDNPWTWWAPGDHRDVYPHFTIWAKNVNEKGMLTEFHITKNFENSKAKPMHIYYKVNTAGKVKYSNSDVGRLVTEEQKQKGTDWIDENALVLDQLAQSFITVGLG